jgi:uridine kinase
VAAMTSIRRPGGGGAARRVIEAARQWQDAQPGILVVALDGHGAAGKSTIAAAVAYATGAALVRTDDFFQRPPTRPGGAPHGGQALAQYYDWRRIRAEALEPLRRRRAAAFRRFDWPRGTEPGPWVTVEPSDLILLEGVFSAAPELSDLVDRSVLVDTPEPERLRRLHARVSPDDWDADWLAAEQAYFDEIRPRSSFGLIVPGTSSGPADPKEGTS